MSHFSTKSVCTFDKVIKILFLLSILFIFGTGYAQYRVTATVINPDGEAEDFATYRIFAMPDTIRPIVGNVTDENGVLNATLPAAGDYRLSVSAAMRLPLTVAFSVSSAEPVADLGILNTENAGEMLNEITVTAQRPLVTKEIDRIGYDVTADADASTSNLREIMRKVPLVTVDDDGTIKVNGSTDFKIYRNGRPNNAFTKNSKDIFAAIPASTIKKIEVITDPGAREDAESSGVILNIVTTSTSSLKGVSGNIGVNWASNQGPNANLFLMTQINKLTLSGTGGYYEYNKNNVKGTYVGERTYDDTGYTIHNEGEFRAGGRGGWFNVEGSLELDTLNLFTTAVSGYIGKNSHDTKDSNTMLDNLGNRVYSYDSKSYYPKNGYTDIDFNFDYQRSTRLKGETITLSYRLSHTRQDQDQKTEFSNMVDVPFGYSSIKSDFDLKFFEHTFQVDWSRPLSSHYKLDTGAKYILRSSHSNNHQNLEDVAVTHDEFEHRYHIFGVYADARATYGKFTARAGLRYEFSRLSADFYDKPENNFHSNLNDFVPNVSLAWNASMSSMWKLTYNRRIQRPGISYLNPAVTNTPTTVSYGNPDLESTGINSILLNYSLIKAKFNLDLTLTYGITNNGTGALKWVEDNITYSTYSNLMHSQTVRLAAFYQWQITPKTTWIFNGNLGWNRYSIETPSESARLARWAGYFFTNVHQKLPWELTLSLGLNYFSGYCGNPYEYVNNPFSNLGYNVGLKRSFLKNKTLDVSLSATSIGMPARKQNSYYVAGGSTGFQSMAQSKIWGITVGVSWRFGNLRAQVKKAANTITNDDLEGRKN